MSEALRVILCAIFKDEQPYLTEWLDFHLAVGAHHCFLYDNGGDAESAELLRPYLQAGVVTVTDWTAYTESGRMSWWRRQFGTHKHHLAYRHCVRHFADRGDWIMKIDLDEFVLPSGAEPSLVDVVHRYERAGVDGIRVPRFNFGDSGHRERRPGPVLEDFQRREPAPSNYKELARLDSLNRGQGSCRSAHHWQYRRGRRRVVPEGEVDDLQLNHYYTKSLAEYRLRQTIDGTREQTMEAFEQRNEGCNAVTDDRAWRRYQSRRNVDGTAAGPAS